MAIDLTIEGKTARIVLNRPEVGNALDTDSCRALLDAVHRCEADPAIRVVILTGAGRMFCAGGDVAGFSSAGSDLPRLLRDLTAPLHMAVARLARMPKPVITAVNGAAAGAGLSLALIGDIVLASDAASFSVAYPGVGLSPDGGATFLLPKLMGLRRAQAFILLNRKLSAAEALDQGLATFVCPSADLAAETQAMAERLSAAPTLAIGRSRMLLADSFAAALESQLEAEARAISACGGEPDALEGIAAFVGRRAPVFDRD